MSEHVRLGSRTIALFVDSERENARSTAAQVEQIARDAGFCVVLCGGQKSSPDSGTRGTLEDSSLLVTIGGDGTLLRAAKVAVPLGLALFGINTGRLGFLTEIEPAELPALSKILRDGYQVDERTLLRADLHGRTHVALNEVVVRRGDTARMTPFGLMVDGQEAARVPADGILVATPTGSTAYFLSAGGPILTPNIAGFGIVALLPHTLFARPLIVPESAVIELTSDLEGANANLEVDGQTVDEVGPTDRVIVRAYERKVRFARRGELAFFSLLEEKLRWNAPIKDSSG